MNLFNKYSPLIYTYTSRFPTKRDYINYLISNIGFNTIPLLYLITIFDQKSTIIYGILGYIYFFYVFSLFYEIGYIYNDYFCIKKEKKPTIRITEKLNFKIIIKMIYIRIFLGILLLTPGFLYSNEITNNFILLLIMMLTIFYIHNSVRNYFINLLTIFMLKISRFGITILILNHLHQTKIIPVILLFFFIDNLVEIIINNNKRFMEYSYFSNSKDINEINFYKLPDIFFDITMLLFCLGGYIFTLDTLYLFYFPFYTIMGVVEIKKYGFSTFNRKIK